MSPFSMWPSSTPPLSLRILPDLRMQKEEARSPSLHILVCFSQYWFMAMSVSACRCPRDSSLRQRDLSMKFLFSAQLVDMISSTAVLKVVRSMYHKQQEESALIEADLGALNSRASSPKPASAGLSFRLISPSISTLIFPSWRMKKQLALSPCRIRQLPCSTLQKLNFSSRLSLMLRSRYEKVKWALRASEMISLSWGFFFLKMLMKLSQIFSSPSSLRAHSLRICRRSSQSPCLVGVRLGSSLRSLRALSSRSSLRVCASSIELNTAFFAAYGLSSPQCYYCIITGTKPPKIFDSTVIINIEESYHWGGLKSRSHLLQWWEWQGRGLPF